MKVLRYPVISITIFLAIGIALGHYAKPDLFVVYAAMAISAIILGIAYYFSNQNFIQRPYFAIASWLFSATVGLLAYSLHYAPNQATHYTHYLNAGENPVVKAVVSERLKPNAYSEKYYANIKSIDKQHVSGKLLVIVPIDLKQRLHAGDVLYIHDDFKPITASLNPYQFNYADYMAGQNVFHQVKLKGNYFKAGQQKNFDYYIDNLRKVLTESFSIHHYSPEVSNMIKALLFGQRQDMDAETNANYTNAGVVHILAISGLHIAVLFYILNLILKPLNRFSRKGKLLQLVVVLAFLWLFAFLSGLSASVVRSVVMFSFMSVGLYFNRSSNIYNSIAVSILFLLLAKPMFLFDVGFQLSYAAVISIVALQPIYKNLRLSKYKALNYIADTVLISLVAQIGVLPLSLYYFNQFPLLFLLANVVVVPLSTILLVVAIIVLLLNFIWTDVAILCGKLLALLIDWMNAFIAWIASFDRLVIKDIPFTMMLNILLYAVIFAGVAWLYKKSFRNVATALSFVILFQGAYMITAQDAKRGCELIVFHNYRSSLIAIKNNSGIAVYSNDSLALENKNLIAYNKGTFNQEVKQKPLKNLLWFSQQKILVVDSVTVYEGLDIKPDIVLLTQSPKINLERMLVQLKPKQVVADATNYKTHIARWAATCRKQKIPFHATAEKGFYKLD